MKAAPLKKEERVKAAAPKKAEDGKQEEGETKSTTQKEVCVGRWGGEGR